MTRRVPTLKLKLGCDDAKESNVPATKETKLKAFIRLARIKFLLYSPLMLGLGVALNGTYSESFGVLLQGLLLMWTIHVNTHFVNEFFDLEADHQNLTSSAWTGGSKVLVAGLLPRKSALTAAAVSSASAILQIYFIKQHPSAVFIAVICLSLSWLYTLPPVALSYRGLGEATCAVVFNILTPLYGYALASSHPIWIPQLFNTSVIIPLIPLAFIGYSRMIVMNLADMKGDTIVGKNTLPAMVGSTAAISIFFILRISAAVFVIYCAITNNIPWSISILFLASYCVPLHVSLIIKLKDSLRTGMWAKNAPQYATQHNAMICMVYVVAWACYNGYLASSTTSNVRFFVATLLPVGLWICAASRLPSNFDALTMEEVVCSPRYVPTPRKK